MSLLTSIPYKKRNQYLILGSLVFLLIVYNYGLSKTWDLYIENKSLASKLSNLDENPNNLEALKTKEEQLNKKLENYIAKDSLSNQGFLLQEMSILCAKNKLILREFPQAIGQDENDYRIRTIVASAQGNYIGLLKMAHQLERSRNVGRLSALKFEKLMDYQTRKEILTARFYFQTIQEK